MKRKSNYSGQDKQNEHRKRGDEYALVAKQKQSVIEAVHALADANLLFAPESFLEYFNKYGHFTPNQLIYLFDQLESSCIEYNPSDFKVKVQTEREEDQLLSMAEWNLDKLWPALSPSQRDWCDANRP